MNLLVHIRAADMTKTLALEEGAPMVTLGRDSSAAVTLPDSDRSISRKHIGLAWASDGARLTVLSRVNGVLTSKGELAPGEQATLAPGEFVELGPYTLTIDRPAEAPAAARPAAGDGFDALLGTGGVKAPLDDPFHRPEFQPAPVPPASVRDPLAAFERDARVGPADAAAAGTSFGQAYQPLPGALTADSTSAGAGSINEFLAAGPPATGSISGLPAAGAARADAGRQRGALAPHHVHEFELPLPIGGAGGAAGAMPGLAEPAPVPRAGGGRDVNAAAAEGAAAAAAGPAALEASDAGWAAIAAWVRGDAAAAPAPAVAAAPPAHAAGAAPSGTAAAAGAPGDELQAMAAFCRGLGVSAPGGLDAQAWERAGSSVRTIVEALAELMAARAELKRELRAEERTMLAAHDNNPLKTDIPLAHLVRHLLFGDVASGFMEPEHALAEAVAELRAHELASVAASRAAVEGALKEFDPARLRAVVGESRLPGLLGSARKWDAYVAHYDQQSLDMADWLERIFDRYFMPAYAREGARLLRLAKPARREAPKA